MELEKSRKELQDELIFRSTILPEKKFLMGGNALKMKSQFMKPEPLHLEFQNISSQRPNFVIFLTLRLVITLWIEYISF